MLVLVILVHGLNTFSTSKSMCKNCVQPPSPCLILNFLCLVTQIIHDPWVIRIKRQRNFILRTFMQKFPTMIFELFFCKKIPPSRRVGYVMDGSMGQWVSEWVSEWEMYVCHTNQIGSTINSQSNSCFKFQGVIWHSRFSQESKFN